jgi:hypothetical protein
LSSTPTTTKLQGTVNGINYNSPTANTTYDATAPWTSNAPNINYTQADPDKTPVEAVEIGSSVPAKGLVWRGGIINGQFPLTTTWYWAHEAGGTGIRMHGAGSNGSSPTFTIEHLRLHNTEDGIKPNEGPDYWVATTASTFLIQHSYFTMVRDDCIENDNYLQGKVYDCLFDGVWTFMSEQTQGDKPDLEQLRSGEDQKMYIDKVFVRLAMSNPFDANATNPPEDANTNNNGPGKFFKWQPGFHRPHITNSVFAIGSQPKAGWSSLSFSDAQCTYGSGNFLCWLGSGTYGGEKPGGMTFLEGSNAQTKWREVRNSWLTRHGYATQGTLAADYNPRTISSADARRGKVAYPYNGG